MLFAGTGVVLGGPLILFFEGRTPHFRAWVTFGRSGLLTFLFHASGGPISFSSEKGRVPRFRARVTFGRSDLLTFLFHASGGPISFSSKRNGGKNAAKNQWFLEFLPADFDAAEKGTAGNRPWVYPRCR